MGLALENKLEKDIQRLVATIGSKKARVVLVLAKEFSISIELAQGFSENPDIVRALRRHPLLMKYVVMSPEETAIDLGRREVRLRISHVHAGYNSDAGAAMESFLRFVDLHTCVFPTPDDVSKEPDELGLLQLSSKGESLKRHRVGALGHVDLTLGHCEGTAVQFVLNGQARKAFWSMRNNIRNSYRKWYERALDAVAKTGREAGAQWLVLPSSDMVNRASKAAWGHEVPPAILNQFYDGFAAKRNFDSETLEVTHPVTNARVSGKVWVKRV